jgi:branched-chain amino acid transport system substrate-binding protein
MRFKKILIIGVAMLMVALVMSSCGGGGDEEGAERVYIGLSAPLSGPGGGYGADCKAGLDMAIDEINSAGGININGQDYIFVLKASDDGAVPEQALANTQRFILEDGINIIVNPVGTTLGPLREINNKPGEEFLLLGYTSTPLWEESLNRLYVQSPPPFTALNKAYAPMAREKGWSRAAFMQTTGAYGDWFAADFKKNWEPLGGTVVADAPSNYYSVTDFTPYINKVMAANPDVIFCGGPSEPTALLIDQARSLGFKGGFVIVDQAKLEIIAEMIGWDKMEGAIGVIPTEVTDAAGMVPFSARYEEEYGKTVTWETVICYGMFNMLVDSMEIAGSVDDVEAIRAAFDENTVSDPEVYPIAFGGIVPETGQFLTPTQYGMVINGQFVAQEPVLWWEEE